MSFVKVLLSVPDSATTMSSILNINTSAQQFDLTQLVKLLGDMQDSAQVAYAKVSTGAIQASGTITLSSMVATDTVTVNGVVFTCVSSGAGANQFNVGLSDTATAANLAASINASITAKVINVVSATSVAAVVTVTAVQPGLAGNMNTIAISAHGSVSGSGFLTSGTDGSQVAVNFGAKS